MNHPKVNILLLAIILLVLTACQESNKGDQGNTTDSASNVIFPDAEEYSIRMLQSLITSGEMSAVSITEMYLDRIQSIDQQGPRINSVIEINPDALALAKKLDEERAMGKVRSPLHGIPILIKDNIDTGDKMQTTAGSLAMEGHYAKNDAFVVRKLRDAGVVILGKTNLSEWANFRSTKSTSAWSSRGGQTLNPYVLSQNPCGSSAGSAAAVVANLCAVSVGTETDGSVTCPAAVCGIVGMKPTIGLISRSGIIPISKTQDTAGPMARSVTDLAILLQAMVGYDPEDPISEFASEFVNVSFMDYLQEDALNGKRVAIDKSYRSSDAKLNAVIDRFIQEVTAAGGDIIDVPFMERIGEIGKQEFDLLMYEFKDGLNKYLANTDAPVKNLAELISYNIANKEKVMPHFGQEILLSSQAKTGLDSKEYQRLYDEIHLGSRRFLDSLYHAYELDAFIGLTIGTASTIDYEEGDQWADLYTPPVAAISGYPHISVPGGYVDGLPVGLSIFSIAGKDAELLGMAYAYEQATRHRKTPSYRTHLPEVEKRSE